MFDNSIKMWNNIANKEDVILDAIVLVTMWILLLMFVVSFGVYAYSLIF